MSIFRNVIRSIVRTLWGDLTKAELRNVGLLSLISFSFMGTYSLLRPFKEILFMHFVGKFYLPSAKFASFLIMIPLTLLYAELVDRIEKHQLFYVFCSLYGVVFMGLAYFLAHPIHGISGATSAHPYAWIGWALYISIESFVMIMVTLFWSFVASNTKNETAKRSYPLIMALTQIGSIVGPELAKNSAWVGIPTLIAGAGLSLFLIIGIVRLFVVYQPSIVAVQRSSRPTGPIEGLRLVARHPYLIAIISTTALYTMVSALLEYQLMHRIEENFQTIEQMATFTGTLVQTTNLVALIFAFVGSSFMIRMFGVKFCLIAFPVLVGSVISYVWVKPELWVIFSAIVTLKGLSYALDRPCKEILYVPTSLDIKFKAKSWIDGFGYRCFFAMGASVNNLFSSTSTLMAGGPIIAVMMCSAWASIAWYLGTRNTTLIQDNTIIE